MRDLLHSAEIKELVRVEPLAGDIEAIPLPDGSVDHVISNGQLGAAQGARPGRVRPRAAAGGKLTVSDLTVDEEELPPEILTHPATWAG